MSRSAHGLILSTTTRHYMSKQVSK